MSRVLYCSTVEDVDTATARGVHERSGQTHGPGVRGTKKTIPSKEIADTASNGHKEKTTVSQLIMYTRVFSQMVVPGL